MYVQGKHKHTIPCWQTTYKHRAIGQTNHSETVGRVMRTQQQQKWHVSESTHWKTSMLPASTGIACLLQQGNQGCLSVKVVWSDYVVFTFQPLFPRAIHLFLSE